MSYEVFPAGPAFCSVELFSRPGYAGVRRRLFGPQSIPTRLCEQDAEPDLIIGSLRVGEGTGLTVWFDDGTRLDLGPGECVPEVRSEQKSPPARLDMRAAEPMAVGSATRRAA